MKISLMMAMCLLGLTGCQSSALAAPHQAKTAPGRTVLATPTINPVFLPAQASVKMPEPSEMPRVQVTDIPTGQPTQATMTSTATPRVEPTNSPTPGLNMSVIYQDQLNPNWAVQTSEGLDTHLDNIFPIHAGKNSIAVNFNRGLESLNFQVRSGASQAFPRNQVQGITFWLNTGDALLQANDLGLSVMGSNRYKTWNPNDASGNYQFYDPVFSGTQAFLLGFSQSVPANTWVQINILLDNLNYPTNFQYLTGIRLKNNAGFRRTVYIDDLALVLRSGN